MSVQLLEDRASLAFWRKVAADRRGEIAPLLSVATGRPCEAYEKGFADPLRSYATSWGLGSVRALGLLRGEEQDHALAEICWDGLWGRGQRALLEGLSKRLGLVRYDFKMALAKGRRARYRESRRAWRGRKAGD